MQERVAKVGRRSTHVAPEVKDVARQLCSLYYGALRTLHDPRRVRSQTQFEPSYGEIDPVARRMFRRAAEAALQVAADPREYIAAQFQRWAEFSQWRGKVVIPMPQHLASVGAQARYIQFKLQKEAREERLVLPESSVRAHFREERKLKGFVRMLRVPPEDVLAEKPEEFTRAFLEHKAIWPLVKDRWLAAQ